MTTAEILNLVALRNSIVAQIESFIEESNLSEDEVYNVISEITEKVNEIAPA
jgi:predicted XRE-type DNA-binding protein